MRKLALILLFVIYKIGIAQSYELFNKDTINVVDLEGKKQGFWIIFNRVKKLPDYKDDQKVEEGKFLDSKKEGLWKEYFANGNVKNKITFKANRPNGYAIIYHENGKVSEEGLWKGNRWVGNYKLYYENGQVQQEFKFNETGKREGPQKYYHENGQLMIEGTWGPDGKESGIIKEYYENGDLRAEKNFNGGTLDPATSKTYDPKKPIVEASSEPVVPKIVVDKEKEKPNIPTQLFNGEGKWTLYNKNKQISKDGEFSKGRLVDGKVYNYTDDGILVRIAVYKDGKYVGDAVIEDN
jgi:antitoxin component YwqK of YwqJK toxin-antitoxin module